MSIVVQFVLRLSLLREQLVVQNPRGRHVAVAVAGTFAAAKDPPDQSTGPRPDHRVRDGLAASPTRFDSAFDIDLLAGGGMIKLHNFGVNSRATPVGHNQPVEPQHHAGMALNSSGHVNFGDVTVHSGVSVLALFNHSRTEGITDL